MISTHSYTAHLAFSCVCTKCVIVMSVSHGSGSSFLTRQYGNCLRADRLRGATGEGLQLQNPLQRSVQRHAELMVQLVSNERRLTGVLEPQMGQQPSLTSTRLGRDNCCVNNGYRRKVQKQRCERLQTEHVKRRKEPCAVLGVQNGCASVDGSSA